MTDSFAGDNELYEVARASPVRIFLASSIQLAIGAAVAAAVTYWITGKPVVLVVAVAIGLVSAVVPALNHRCASLERVEETLWGPSSNGWIPGDSRERARIRLEDIDRNARTTWGLLAPFLGWRQIRGRRGEKIRYCRWWYDTTDLDTFLTRLGLG